MRLQPRFLLPMLWLASACSVLGKDPDDLTSGAASSASGGGDAGSPAGGGSGGKAAGGGAGAGATGGTAGGGAAGGAGAAGTAGTGAGGVAGAGGTAAGGKAGTAGGVGNAGTGGKAGAAGAAGVGGMAGAGAGGASGAAGAGGAVCSSGQSSTCAAALGLDGNCGKGTVTCMNGLWSACSVSPQPKDACTPDDDANCNGIPNEGCPCMDGVALCGAKLGALGACASGTTICSNGQWGPCSVTPAAADACTVGNDATCDGIPNKGCACSPGEQAPCGQKLGAKGSCAAGVTTCGAKGWGACSIKPAARDGCVPKDDATCDGVEGAGCGPSCGAGADCGGTSCCEQRLVPGGAFTQGEAGVAEPMHTTTVAPFLMDTFEVTVGRYRRFLETYPASRPKPGQGAHPLVAGSGWDAGWDANLAADRPAFVANLVACSGATWTDAPGANETLPMNCVTWYELFAFCAWDGGRLPTEAEWEFAARGGIEERRFPWGTPPKDPAPDSQHAVYGGTPLTYVGSHPAGDARWGQSDLAGSVQEWVLDLLDPYSAAPCDNCANLAKGDQRILRGGAWTMLSTWLRGAVRGPGAPPVHRAKDKGGRCVKSL